MVCGSNPSGRLFPKLAIFNHNGLMTNADLIKVEGFGIGMVLPCEGISIATFYPYHRVLGSGQQWSPKSTTLHFNMTVPSISQSVYGSNREQKALLVLQERLSKNKHGR